MRVRSAAALKDSRNLARSNAATPDWPADAIKGAKENSMAAATKPVEQSSTARLKARRLRPHFRARNACTKPNARIKTANAIR